MRHRIAAAIAVVLATVAVSVSASNAAHAAGFQPPPTYGWTWGE
jgi:uncharacterized membrane protein